MLVILAVVGIGGNGGFLAIYGIEPVFVVFGQNIVDGDNHFSERIIFGLGGMAGLGEGSIGSFIFGTVVGNDF